LTEIHVSPRKSTWAKELEEIIVETNSMSVQDWKKMLCFSWTTMLFHSLKVVFYIMAFLHKEYGVRYSEVIAQFSDGDFDSEKYPLLRHFYKNMDKKTENILSGEGRGVLAPEYGDIYWEQEEILFFEISKNIEQFYNELYHLICAYLDSNAKLYDAVLLKSVFKYQALCIPVADAVSDNLESFEFNLYEYFENLFTSREVGISRKKQVILFGRKMFDGDNIRFARETILWKRKNGSFLNGATLINR
jgi:putative methyltransferase